MKGFTFFENFFDSISDDRNGLTPAQEGEVYRAILYYVFRGEELPLEGVCRMAFNLIRPSLDISRVRSAARRSAEKATEHIGANDGEPNIADGKKQVPEEGSEGENQNEIKRESNENQNEIKSENLTFLEETETETEIETEILERKKESKKIILPTTGAGARVRGKPLESYDSIMDDFEVGPMTRAALGQFIQHCALNGKKITNNKLKDIILRLQEGICYTEYGENCDKEQSDEVYRAISGGYFDIKVGRK